MKHWPIKFFNCHILYLTIKRWVILSYCICSGFIPSNNCLIINYPIFIPLEDTLMNWCRSACLRLLITNCFKKEMLHPGYISHLDKRVNTVTLSLSSLSLVFLSSCTFRHTFFQIAVVFGNFDLSERIVRSFFSAYEKYDTNVTVDMICPSSMSQQHLFGYFDSAKKWVTVSYSNQKWKLLNSHFYRP